jgi:hypothetical protein
MRGHYLEGRILPNRTSLALLAATLLILPSHAAETGDPVFCEPLSNIVSAAQKSGGFDRLIDSDKQTLTTDDGVLEYYPSNLNMGACLIDTTVEEPKIICTVPLTPRDPKSLEFYHTFIQQVSLCLADKITSSKINMKANKKFLPDLFTNSTFKIGDNLRLEVSLSNPKSLNNLCGEMPYENCKDEYGVFFKASLLAN